MLWYFDTSWAFAMIGAGFILGWFLRIPMSFARVMDIFSLGMGQMSNGGYIQGVLMSIFAPLMATFCKWGGRFMDIGVYGEILVLLIYLWFVIQMTFLTPETTSTEGSEGACHLSNASRKQ